MATLANRELSIDAVVDTVRSVVTSILALHALGLVSMLWLIGGIVFSSWAQVELFGVADAVVYNILSYGLPGALTMLVYLIATAPVYRIAVGQILGVVM